LRLCVIGVGQAGAKVADLFAYYNTWKWSNHANVTLLNRGNLVPISLAVNTSKSDLTGLRSIPKKNRILIGQTSVRGRGTGMDNELGAKVMKEEMDNVNRALSVLKPRFADAFLVTAGLGGGTGSGAGAVLVRHIKNTHEEPVYALGILPARDEGRLMTLNAARSLLALQETADSLIIFDNESWKREGTSLAKSYLHMNQMIVKPFGYLLGAGETNKESKIGVKVVDASDIMNTLGGFTVLGYAESAVEKGFSLFKERSSIERLNTSTLCYSIVKNAANPEALSTKCEITDAEKGLILVSGPPQHLDREGIERGRKFLENAIWGKEVRCGDYPLPRSKKMVGVVLLSGLVRLSRVKELLDEGAEVQKELKKKARRRAKIADIGDYRDKLKPLVGE